MNRKIIMGVDLNLKTIATSTYYSFGDDCFFYATKAENTDKFVNEWIGKFSYSVIHRAKQKEVNIIALENLNTSTMSCSDRQKKVLNAFLLTIPKFAKESKLETLLVDPRNTSKRCFHCGGFNTIRDDRGFQCLDGCIIGEENVDYNAAQVIGTLAIINQIKQDRRSGINWNGKYFLATYSSPKPIEEIPWALKIINDNL